MAQARQTGDRAEARTLAKEQKEGARRTKEAERSKAAAKPAATGKPAKPTQKAAAAPAATPLGTVDRAAPPHASEPAKPATPKPLSPAVVDDIPTMESRRPPTHDYVKGVLAGIRYARGMVDSPELAKPWQSYILHVQGAAKPAKAKAKAKARK